MKKRKKERKGEERKLLLVGEDKHRPRHPWTHQKSGISRSSIKFFGRTLNARSFASTKRDSPFKLSSCNRPFSFSPSPSPSLILPSPFYANFLPIVLRLNSSLSPLHTRRYIVFFVSYKSSRDPLIEIASGMLRNFNTVFAIDPFSLVSTSPFDPWEIDR